MPVNTSTGAVTAEKTIHTLQGEESGVAHDCDFAVCSADDVKKQVRFDCSGVATGTSVTLLPNGIASSSTEVQLTFHSGVATPETVTDLNTNDSTVTMRLRKVGDTVFCSINAFILTPFAGTTGQSLRSQALAIPLEYHPLDDNHSFLFVQTDPSTTTPACWAPFYDRHIEYFKDGTYDGFTNSESYTFPTVTAVWSTAGLDGA